YFKGHEELANGGDLAVIVAAVVGPEFQLRYRDGRQPDHVALRLGLPAARDQGQRLVTARALPSRGLETAQHENDRVGVQQVKHDDQSRDSRGGCTRLPLMNWSESCSTPSKKTSHGSFVITRTPSAVRLRRPSLASTRTSFGSQIAWLRPVRNTLATA